MTLHSRVVIDPKTELTNEPYYYVVKGVGDNMNARGVMHRDTQQIVHVGGGAASIARFLTQHGNDSYFRLVGLPSPR